MDKRVIVYRFAIRRTSASWSREQRWAWVEAAFSATRSAKWLATRVCIFVLRRSIRLRCCRELDQISSCIHTETDKPHKTDIRRLDFVFTFYGYQQDPEYRSCYRAGILLETTSTSSSVWKVTSIENKEFRNKNLLNSAVKCSHFIS